jgi:adenylosuccinate synthase
MMLHPLAMLAEERHLRTLGIDDAFARMRVDTQALVTTPFQQSANRIKEMLRGEGRHGSCGMGVGETMVDWLTHGASVLFAGDLPDRKRVIQKLRFIRDAKWAEIEAKLSGADLTDELTNELNTFHDPHLIEATADVYTYFAGLVTLTDIDYLRHQRGTVIFEGAQGVLLDEWYGFFPYNSWSALSFKNAVALLTEAGFDGQTTRLGLLRAYATRHGAGPFPTEDAALTAALPDPHNGHNPWQRHFRVGPLDFVMLRYALKVTGGVDGLVVTHLDRLETLETWRTCNAYIPPEKARHLDKFFALENGHIRAIKVSADPTDLPREEERTRLLSEMQPIYDDCPRKLDSYLERISETLALPIAMTSAGPTALEKTWRGVTTPC